MMKSILTNRETQQSDHLRTNVNQHSDIKGAQRKTNLLEDFVCNISLEHAWIQIISFKPVIRGSGEPKIFKIATEFKEVLVAW